MFQKIDEYGFITDAKWYLNLNRHYVKRFLMELLDIWQYRAQITNEVRRNISPPNGNPFENVPMGTLLHKSELALKIALAVELEVSLELYC